jgi:hypothetical protein
MGFGLVIGFIDLLQVVTTIKHSAIANCFATTSLSNYLTQTKGRESAGTVTRVYIYKNGNNSDHNVDILPAINAIYEG